MGKPKFGKSVVQSSAIPSNANSDRRTDKQLYAQAALPLTLIPIRIDLEIPLFTPAPALPLPTDAHAFGINPSLPAYKPQEPTRSYRFRDVFMWNLHETLITPEQFSHALVQELDLPNASALAVNIAKQIRHQLEDYSGVALHPLFRTASTRHQGTTGHIPATHETQGAAPVFPEPSTPHFNETQEAATVQKDHIATNVEMVQANAILVDDRLTDAYNPDDAYRCIVTLNVNLLNKLYTDKFEWSLLHPSGVAEHFAHQTCADIGLSGEWATSISHAIHEAVLRLQKEACESGWLSQGHNGELDNMAPDGQEAGWRYDNEHLADSWEPKLEVLSKEEIEKREGDRERQIRRQRRETARFTSTVHLGMAVPTPGPTDPPDSSETPMGRGERSKKKRRFRSLSPTGRGATPAGISETASGDNGFGAPTEG